MSEQAEILSPHRQVGADTEVHLLDLLTVLVRQRRLVLGIPLATGTIALAASFLMAPTFTSTAKIMPPQQQQTSGMAAMLGQLGGLAGAAGGLSGLKSPNDLYAGMLESRTVADNLIARFKLKERYKTSTMDDTRRALAQITEINNGKKDGFISVSANDHDPQFAADLANGFVQELDKLTQTMTLTDASKRRVFFEKQLKEASEQLAVAEVALRTTQERTGIIQPDAQVRAIISNVAQVSAAIAAKEVQLNSLRTFSTSQNPEIMRTQEELRSLIAQRVRLEKNQSATGDDLMVPTRKIPQFGVEYVRSVRNVKYYETIYELLAKQYELAKMEEAKDSSSIQLLDKAVPAERKSKPRTVLMVLSGLLGGGVLGILMALIQTGYVASRRDPEISQRWEQLSTAWHERSAACRSSGKS